MEERSFQVQVIEGYQITIPKSTRFFKGINVGDFVDVTIGDVKRPKAATPEKEQEKC